MRHWGKQILRASTYATALQTPVAGTSRARWPRGYLSNRRLEKSDSPKPGNLISSRFQRVALIPRFDMLSCMRVDRALTDDVFHRLTEPEISSERQQGDQLGEPDLRALARVRHLRRSTAHRATRESRAASAATIRLRPASGLTMRVRM